MDGWGARGDTSRSCSSVSASSKASSSSSALLGSGASTNSGGEEGRVVSSPSCSGSSSITTISRLRWSPPSARADRGFAPSPVARAVSPLGGERERGEDDFTVLTAIRNSLDSRGVEGRGPGPWERVSSRWAGP